ncbi:MAG: hypothetical protein F2947_00675 [Actinobacteria bacterium]|jgi:hypothetical protein|uniref:Unannotated protein n=1 Tax=freshwater metagenome TaxID=449393 RepID=A0A6J5ZAC7_9ZZZZ|nr:hypothetical protein [Actinomycetota bacterium]MSW32826.1 hypothetical protein [Actinomycetota bacterium]MSX34130.1 hypothetical protein [Actinomycetota bacterium]MSY24621.1 hypothetical protein [Actinomycetota bacterium]MSY33502.1 hypothetical protein [Actinomycetota bacterium]
MNLRSRIVLLAFVLWTVFVWGNRISNTLRSEESASSKTFSTVLSVILLAFAVGVIVVVAKAWKSQISLSGAKVLMVAAALTVVVWLVRVPMILMADHGDKDPGFKIVHVGLGLVSVVLAALVWQIGAVVLRQGRGSSTMESSRA